MGKQVNPKYKKYLKKVREWVVCRVCGRPFSTLRGAQSHVRQAHMTKK